ncbi:MAG: thiamine phosphate synthase [Legionellales bacterium]|jgi:thiamine-phosphate diphosphorylase
MIHLPDCWWITPDINAQDECESLLALLDTRFKQGIRAIQFRQTLLNPDAFNHVYSLFSDFCQKHNIPLMINGSVSQVIQLNAKGCYLNSERLMEYSERPLSTDYWVGAYCHNLEELLHAQKLHLDFVSISPVKKTLSHPEKTPLGWDAFQTLAAQTSLPVYALGGLSLSDKPEALARGGQGIMGIRFISN